MEEFKNLRAHEIPTLSSPKIKSLGIGLSYPSHQEEAQASTAVFFEKNAAVTPIDSAIPYRPHLDYETEVSLILHRRYPTQFGYQIHNDLTDRRIQVKNYDKANPGPGFSLAKSLPTLNAHSENTVYGDSSVWENIEVRMFVNGILRQTLKTQENIFKPEDIHRIIFTEKDLAPGFDWVLVGTGTPAGTIFRAPAFWEKLGLITSSFFSVGRAQDKWLESFRFLQEGDKLEFDSPTLGYTKTTVAPQTKTL
jgi:2-keto-4-pentenoate hydratase/2-oxohepta-3-ene-1,7-dioic acid hydratase in catechol pathway